MLYNEHPASYLAKLKVACTDPRASLSAIAHMPYPADPLVEPELVGLTFYQVGLLRQAGGMAAGILESMEFFADRLTGRPAQVNLNVNADKETLDSFLQRIHESEKDVIDVTPTESAAELGL